MARAEYKLVKSAPLHTPDASLPPGDHRFYTQKDVWYDNNGPYIAITLENATVKLYGMNVPKDQPDNPQATIFRVDVSTPELFKPAARVLARMILQSDPDALVTPRSSKSELCIQRAVALANRMRQQQGKAPVPLFQLLGATPDQGLPNIPEEDITTYRSIVQEKVMAVNPHDKEALKGMNGKRIAAIDDGISEGGTLQAMQTTLNRLLELNPQREIPAIFLFREVALIDDHAPEDVPLPSPTIQYAFTIPALIPPIPQFTQPQS